MAGIGSFLGSVYRTELAARVELGRLDHKAHAVWRAQRKQALTAVSSSRWAGAITRAVEDQYQLGMRALSVHVADLGISCRGARSSGVRCAPVSRKPSPPVLAGLGGGVVTGRLVSGSRRPGGWRSCVSDSPSRRRRWLRVGRRSRWAGNGCGATAHHLDEAGMTEPQWRARWDAARMFLTADGESGKAGGNETIRVDEAGRLRIKVPAALVAQHGTHIDVAAPVAFGHRGTEWAVRVAGRRAVRYDITYDSDRGPLVSGRVLETGHGGGGTVDRRVAHRPGARCRSQRRSPRRLRARRVGQSGRGPDHDPRGHRRFGGIAA